jgi:hypothetical protein
MSSALDLSTLLEAGVKPGRRASSVPFAVSRELTAEDLLATGEAASIQALPIKSLRQSHHQLARLVAQGEKPAVISEITGYSINRISVLKSDPQFTELVTHYTEMEQAQHQISRADFHERLAAIGYDSIEILHERLLEDADSITTAELLKILEAAADRTGHGKTSTVNANVTSLVLTAEELAEIRSQSAPREAHSSAEANRESLLRLAVRASDPHPDQSEKGREAEGAGVREESDQVVEFIEVEPEL